MEIIVTIYESNGTYEAVNGNNELPFGVLGQGDSLDEVKEDFKNSLKEMIEFTKSTINFEKVNYKWIIKNDNKNN